MIPFPTDAEIIHAIRVLARGNVLRQYQVRNAVAEDHMRRYQDAAPALRARVEEDARRQIAAKLVELLAGPATWLSSPAGFNRCEVCETTGWVISFADARRALEVAP